MESKKPNRRLYVTGIILLVCVFAALVLKTPDTDRDAMLNKYSNQYSRFIQDETGLRIHIREQGNKNGIPIVFLHGSTASLHVFEPMLELIKQDYRLISYDHPGHGLTGPNPNHEYTYQGYAKALDLVRTELGLERFILVGHSMGGWISWRYAAEHPDAIDALVLMSASGMPSLLQDDNRDIGMALRISKSAMGKKIPEYIMPRNMTANSTYAAIYNDDIVTDELVEQIWELMRYPGNRQAFTLRMQLDRDEHLAHLAKSIQAPTLLIWGEEDTFVPPVNAKSFSNRIKVTETVLLPNVGHIPMLEAPEKTVQAIEKFLEKNTL